MSSLKPSSRCRVIALTVLATLALAPALARAESPVADVPVLQPFALSKDVTDPGWVALAVDFIIILPIGADIGTILLGNSAIADATLTDGRMIVLKGVTKGMTNMIVLDTAGDKLVEIIVQVSDRKPGMVTVRRAMATQSYACLAGTCDGSGTPAAGASANPAGVLPTPN